MPAWKVTYSFVAANGNAQTGGSLAGWTESWYLPGNLFQDAAVTEARTLLTNRRNLLTPGWACDSIRMIFLDESNRPTRRGVLFGIPPPNGNGMYGGVGAANNEQPYDAINVAISSALGSRRAFLMRGIGSDVVAPSGRFANPPGWFGPFVIFTGDLAGQIIGGPANSPWALRVRSATATTALITWSVVAVANVNIPCDARRPMINVAINTVQAGNQVSITGAEGPVNLNSSWEVVRVQLDPLNNTRNWVGLKQKRRIAVSGDNEGGGLVTYWRYALVNINGGTPRHGASRRTGRPSGITRGRRSTRRP